MSSVLERGQAQGPVRGVGGVEKEGAFQPVEEVHHLSKVEKKKERQRVLYPGKRELSSLSPENS